MAPSHKYSPVLGERVFARVKGHPAWPARVTKVLPKSFTVLFYGTFDSSPAMKANALWPYTPENIRIFSPNGQRMKSFREGMAQIKDNPEIIPLGYAEPGAAGEMSDAANWHPMDIGEIQIQPELNAEGQIQVIEATNVLPPIPTVKISVQGVEVEMPGYKIKIGKMEAEVPTDKRCAIDHVSTKIPEIISAIVGKVGDVHKALAE